MASAETHAAITLKEIRRKIEADSALFGERLRPEQAMPNSAGYSDLFMDACDGYAGVSSTIRLGIEYIFEGYLLHYGQSRLLGPDDGHFNLLAGDYMYARGLEAIARLEDLACVEALAELVRLCSYIHCEKLDPALAAKAWAVTTLGLAARVSSGGTVPVSIIPAFGELEKLDASLEGLLAAGDGGGAGSDCGNRGGADSDDSGGGPGNGSTSLRERFSNIEADFHGS